MSWVWTSLAALVLMLCACGPIDRNDMQPLVDGCTAAGAENPHECALLIACERWGPLDCERAGTALAEMREEQS